MHTYGAYGAPSPAAEVELVRDNPFAVVVSAEPGAAPVGTHVPVILQRWAAPPESLSGATMLGHLARRNPQWRAFAARPEILLVFSGPHGYVSPTTYGYQPAVPTLNYAAVHLTGTVELVEDRAATLDVVEQTVLALESRRDPPWDMGPSRATFATLVEHVVAFTMRVTGVHSMFKLSQDMPPDVRARVRADVHPPLADLMSAVDTQDPATS